ncbi:MAG: type I-F CRISPR-associated endoribonuclease Cas6/Csy4 [Moraxellaceae bacterium]|nr:type I-F CRISPR-associated endoribonuclease Cas6/Csy4 [Moraxellaceae bacterium]
MKYYQEITILPDPEIDKYFIWQKLYTQLHIALADLYNRHGIDSIGVSFPNYEYEVKNGKTFATLGSKLRVFANSKEDLTTLNLDKWLERLDDYVHIKKIAEVGDKATSYVSVQRYRHKPIEMQAISLAKKLGISYEKALVTVKKRKSEMKLPFIKLYSQTNKIDYNLQILQQPIIIDEQTKDNKDGKKCFNVYGMTGMSKKIAVPHW